MGFIGTIIYLAFIVVVIAGMWKAFEKAGEPGWGAIVPIYNIYLMMKIAGRPIWWIILLFIPIANLIVAIIVNIDIAKRFGQGTGFGIGLAFLGFVFWPILGFGDAQFIGDGAESIDVGAFGKEIKDINSESQE